MSNYIVNPIWFYLIGVADALKGVSIILCVILSVVIFFSVADVIQCGNRAIFKIKHINRMIIIFILLSSISIFVPNKEVCYQMMLSSQVTHKNIQLVIEEAEKLLGVNDDE